MIKVLKRGMLPTCIVQLIKSFLPGVEPYIVPEPYWFIDYMQTDGWNDVQEVRAYGDF